MNSPLRCIIVDDEEGAHRVLEHYLHSMASLTLSASFFNGIEAVNYMYKNPVDLVFLDINMPGLTGMQMLEAMSDPPFIILTTAYTEYALEGYKYQVVDYLVKPIELPAFLAAVDKVFARLGAGTGAVSRASGFLLLKVEGDMLRVPLDSICYIQSMGNYIKVFTEKEIYISPVTTSDIEHKLDKARFKRIHKSYIVALQRILRITGSQVQMENDIALPVGITYRRELLDYFQ